MGMLRLSASRRAEGKPALPTQQPYTTVNVEPNLIGTKRRRPYERQLYKLLVLLGKGAVGLILLCPVVFLLTWNHLFAIDVGSSVTETAGKLMSPKTFTVRMNTWRRNDLLKISVEHLATCDCVGQIQVVWSDQENDPPGLEFFEEAARDKIRFEIHDTNSLSHRFNMTLPMETDGVFSTDDDLHISCADLKFGFESWQSSQKTMVGFTPRMVTLDPKTERFSYRSWRVVRWNGVYNVILTKCCFLHQEHLRTYMENMSEKVLAYIDQQRNCEDIAMSVVVAKYYKTPPLWVKGRVKEIGGDGISAKYDHFEARSACVDFFVEQFGGMPLIETSTKLYPMHSKLLSWL